MGLFSNPVVFNDGTDDRTFDFRSQRPDAKSIVGDYIESGSLPAAASLITIKHDLRAKTALRDLLQRTHNVVPAASTDGLHKPITINLTIVAHELFSASEIEKELNITIAAANAAGFVAGMRNRLI